MADSILVDDLQRATGKTREECEKALAATNGDYDEAVVKLGGRKARGVDLNEAAHSLKR